jgi:hypothetical protein
MTTIPRVRKEWKEIQPYRTESAIHPTGVWKVHVDKATRQFPRGGGSRTFGTKLRQDTPLAVLSVGQVPIKIAPK